MDGPTVSRSDQELVAALVEGDDAALATLYDRHGEAVFRIAFRRLGDRQLAEEVMQETFLALWNRAELFDARLGSLSAWLGTIARNRSVDRLRAIGRRPVSVVLSSIVGSTVDDERAMERTLESATPVGGGGRSPDPELVAEEGWLRDEVRQALDGMPHHERRVIELAYYEELSQSEIAAHLGWPLGTVKTRTRRALARLRGGLGEALGRDLGPHIPAPVAIDPGGPENRSVEQLRPTATGGRGVIDGPR